VALAFAASLGVVDRLGAAERPLAHMVFFRLKDRSEDSRQQLVAGCQKYLSGHEGVIYFSVGTLAEDLQREVNDLDFDVALHMVFRDKVAHDKYQAHATHVKFIEEFRSGWSRVRVFDSYLADGKAEASSR
jgi:hypothetical protein